METTNMTQEQISALADNELSDQHLEMAFAALRQAEGRAAWDVYHQIGDVLRSDDMAGEFSPDFHTRLMARLDAEPIVIAPQNKPVDASPEHAPPMVAVGGARASTFAFRRFAAPTAVAAVAVLALVTSPQLLTALKGGPAKDQLLTQMVVSNRAAGGNLQQVALQQRDTTVNAATPSGVVLRDPRIDEYLLAHQRFSPAWNSTAQYARSATFAPDSSK
jgi:sigma-E factor negative regulatory protein RseA